ncbi:DUF3053 family protein [Acidovorax sp. Leaf78]|uniref:DUF3053 family protein n=1 Tax=Acidovorax sp. Leaf78 TaxID=1736237 RepID=UPI0006FE968B|nr:DUF3053 family protein [Acidovorax sp. Leaf78]KQO27316.1 hypothetical protein ASF16_00160 [Acidovorax sp. Leaf78]
MLDIASRRAALTRLGALSLGAALTLNGCSSEPGERKAFIEFLQTRVLNTQRAAVPQLNEQQRKAFGAYAAHYDIITAFNQEMNEAPLTRMMNALQNTRTLPQLIAKRTQVNELLAHLPQAQKEVQARLDRANAAKKALTQPDDLRVVYDAAFDKLVTQLAALMLQLLPATQGMLAATMELVTYVEQNPKEVSFVGSNVQATTQASLDKVNVLLKKLETEAAAVAKMETALRKLAG